MSKTSYDKEAIKDKWLSHFDLLANATKESSPEALIKLRKEAISSFSGLGFPTTRHEEWKYTSVMPILKKEFSHSFFSKKTSLTQEQFLRLPYLQDNGHQLVFVNGFFDSALSSIKTEPDGVIIGNVANIMQQNPELAAEYFAKNTDVEHDAFSALNTAFAQDGAFVFVPKNTSTDNLIQIVNITFTDEENTSCNTKNILRFEAGSSASVKISAHHFGTKDAFTNSAHEIYAGANSNIHIYEIQDDVDSTYAINNTNIEQQADSVVDHVVITLGGAFIRNNLTFHLKGQNCESNLSALYLLDKDQHVDNHTLVDHAVPNCNSNELYKGVMNGSSTAVFNGKVIVRPQAQKTNAFQSNKNILLSPDATINTKPQLEIFADDVKCSHGATTGKMDEAALFYLKARGIKEDRAKAMLTVAFANDVLQKIENEELKNSLEARITENLMEENS